ncbi:MAG: 3-methyl-2-oxobutanoate hydroxymethyltransferase [Bdellovibrionales bacterium]
MTVTPLTAPDILATKGQRKLTEITAYDYPTALWVDESGADMVLVGDSLAMVVLGREDTLCVTMEEMLHHTRIVSRTTQRALVVADLPFMSYHVSIEQAVTNAGRLIQDGGARAVKLEGGARVLPQIRAILDAQIPVQGHLGLTPQSAAAFGGFKVQGKTASAAQKIIDEAKALADAGCFSIVLEGIPAPIAELVTQAVSIPTIGIGAGPQCDGQVLVIHDILGMFDRFTPKFVKHYANFSSLAKAALTSFRQDVEQGAFPDQSHEFSIKKEELQKLVG